MVYHVLKDGSRPNDIKGYVLKVEHNQTLYNVIDNIAKRGKSCKRLEANNDSKD